MPRSSIYRDVNCHNKLTLQDRIRVIKAYKKTRSYRKLASEFKCSLYQIRSIIREKKTILKEYVQAKEYQANKYAQTENIVNFQVVTLLEKVLYEWFQRAQTHIETGPITNEIFLQKAEEAKQIFCMKNFDTDLEWLLRFRQKYDITELDMTMLRIGNGNEPLSLDMNEIVVYIVDQNSMSEYLAYNESLSGLDDSDFESDNHREIICQKIQIQMPEEDCRIESKIIDESAEGIELIIPPIANNDQARLHLKILEDYALMRENFRAIGLIAQLEETFNANNRE